MDRLSARPSRWDDLSALPYRQLVQFPFLFRPAVASRGTDARDSSNYYKNTPCNLHLLVRTGICSGSVSSVPFRAMKHDKHLGNPQILNRDGEDLSNVTVASACWCIIG